MAALRSSKPPDPDRTRTLAPFQRARDVSVACLSATQDGLVQLLAGAPRRVDLAISAVCKTARARFDSAARLHAPADGSEDRLLSGPAKARTLPGAPRRVRLQARSSVSQADQMGSIPIRGALSLPTDRRPRYERGWRWFDSTQRRECRRMPSIVPGQDALAKGLAATLRRSLDAARLRARALRAGVTAAFWVHTPKVLGSIPGLASNPMSNAEQSEWGRKVCCLGLLDAALSRYDVRLTARVSYAQRLAFDSPRSDKSPTAHALPPLLPPAIRRTRENDPTRRRSRTAATIPGGRTRAFGARYAGSFPAPGTTPR